MVSLTDIAEIYALNVPAEVYAYLGSRGISKETIRKYKIGYASNSIDAFLQRGYTLIDISNDPNIRNFVFKITFPNLIDKECVHITSRTIQNNGSRYVHSSGPIRYLYNEYLALKRRKPIIITEGIINCLTLLQFGYNAVSCYSATVSSLLTKKIISIAKNRPVIIYFDNDHAGITGALKLAQRLEQSNVRIVLSPGKEDINELVTKLKYSDTELEVLIDNALLPDKYAKILGIKYPLESPNSIINHKDNNKYSVLATVSKYIKLRKAGSSYRALCPFHKDSRPSLYVSPTHNIWHCFGCNQGSSAIDFIMLYEKVDYKKAIQLLNS